MGGEGLGLQGNRSWGRFTFHNKDRRRTTLFWAPRGVRRGGEEEPRSRKGLAAQGPERSRDFGWGGHRPHPLSRSPSFSLPPPSLATNTDGTWDGALSGAKTSPSLSVRSSDAGEGAPGMCPFQPHYSPRVAGARGCEQEASEELGALAPAVGVRERGAGGLHIPETAGLVPPGAPHLLQGAPPPPPVLSRCRRFLNQLLTCVSERPVRVARRRFSSGVG